MCQDLRPPLLVVSFPKKVTTFGHAVTRVDSSPPAYGTLKRHLPANCSMAGSLRLREGNVGPVRQSGSQTGAWLEEQT